LVQARVRQLHLGLDARDLSDREADGLIGGVAQQRRLADARFATDDEYGALPGARVFEQPPQLRLFVRPAPDLGSIGPAA
jgi:hypothetical protein